MKILQSTAMAAFLAGSALSTPALAQSSAPFSFPGGSSASSSAPGFWLLPTSIALGFGLAMENYTMLDILTGERLYAPSNRYIDLLVRWQLAAYSAAAFLQFGLYNFNGDVERVVQPSGASFNTTGDLKEKGVFAGAGIEANVDGTPVTPNDNKLKIEGALSLGYAWQEFSAFGGGFSRDDEGVFVRVEAGLDIPVGANTNFSLNPAVIYTHFDGDRIRSDNTVFALRAKFKF